MCVVAQLDAGGPSSSVKGGASVEQRSSNAEEANHAASPGIFYHRLTHQPSGKATCKHRDTDHLGHGSGWHGGGAVNGVMDAERQSSGERALLSSWASCFVSWPAD